MSWLAKVKRNGGGESILSSHEDYLTAAEVVAKLNHDYQADNYYVEEYDRGKDTWPR